MWFNAMQIFAIIKAGDDATLTVARADCICRRKIGETNTLNTSYPNSALYSNKEHSVLSLMIC